LSTLSPFLSIEGLNKSFDGKSNVLESIDLNVLEGDFISLIGPSGCGKSTVLKLIAGLIAPSAGAINFGQRDPPLNESLSYVFQDATLLPWQTVIDNVALPLKIKGVDKPTRLKTAAHFIDLVGLNHAADLYPRELSGGMKMRVSIARALSLEPALLLLDEPFGALDEMTRDTLNEELLKLREATGWTAIFVTHSVAEAVFLSSRVIVLRPNPGEIADIIDIPLTYPRNAETRQTQEFLNLVIDVTRALRQVHEEINPS
jgi:NitT/TauT family transport system ATP-binding protein